MCGGPPTYLDVQGRESLLHVGMRYLFPRLSETVDRLEPQKSRGIIEGLTHRNVGQLPAPPDTAGQRCCHIFGCDAIGSRELDLEPEFPRFSSSIAIRWKHSLNCWPLSGGLPYQDLASAFRFHRSSSTAHESQPTTISRFQSFGTWHNQRSTRHPLNSTGLRARTPSCRSQFVQQ